MKNPEFVNLYFTDSPDTAYYKEMSDFQSPYDCINMLTQAYVRILNNLKKGWLSREDAEFTNLLQNSMHQVLRIYFKTLDTEKGYYPLFEETETFLDIIENFEPQITKLLNVYAELPHKNLTASNINVSFQLLYGPLGPAVMYNVTPHMNSFIQLNAYLILFKLLIPKLSHRHLKLFIYYASAITSLLDEQKASFKTQQGMVDLIRRATPMLVEIAHAKQHPDINEFVNFLPTQIN